MRATLTLVATAAALLIGTASRADDILAGIDMFQTLGCGSGVDTSQVIPGGIPPNFFDPGSDPFTGVIPLTGEPLTTAPPGAVFPVDTIVERQAQAVLPLVCGPADTIPIEILALSLTSMGCGPITVTYFGGMNPELWNVDASLSSIFPQQTGSLTISHDCPEGGTLAATLPVTPKVVFTRQSDSAVRVLDVGFTLPLNTVFGHWMHGDPGFGVQTTPGGFLVDKDGDMIPETGPVPGSTNFFPGLRHLPCECGPVGPGPFPAPTDDIGAVIEEKPGGAATHVAFPPGPCGPPALDSDGDGIGDLCDNLPNTPNPGQEDDDDDTVGNPDPADHFQCYEIKPASQAPTFLSSESQFGPLDLTLRFPHRLCAPANKNNEGIQDPVQHLVGYAVRNATTFVRRQRQTIVNQLGSIVLDVVRPDLLLVPTGKNGVPLPPDTIDHFQCYKVKRSRGMPKFVPQTVTVGDQFENITVLLKKPQLLCAPTNKIIPPDQDGEDPTAPFHPDHLLCYKAKSQTRFGTLGVTLDNQFGPDQASLIHRREFCVPSLKNPPTTTTTITTSTTSTSTATGSSSSTSSSTTPTTNAPTTTTTLYGSPSRAFLSAPGGLLD